MFNLLPLILDLVPAVFGGVLQDCHAPAPRGEILESFGLRLGKVSFTNRAGQPVLGRITACFAFESA
jgi:hypothetical protein